MLPFHNISYDYRIWPVLFWLAIPLVPPKLHFRGVWSKTFIIDSWQIKLYMSPIDDSLWNLILELRHETSVKFLPYFSDLEKIWTVKFDIMVDVNSVDVTMDYPSTRSNGYPNTSAHAYQMREDQDMTSDYDSAYYNNTDVPQPFQNVTTYDEMFTSEYPVLPFIFGILCVFYPRLFGQEIVWRL